MRKDRERLLRRARHASPGLFPYGELMNDAANFDFAEFLICSAMLLIPAAVILAVVFGLLIYFC